MIWKHEVLLEMSPFHQTRKRLLMRLLDSPVRAEGPVLDVGCGIGDLIASLAGRGLSAHGTDVALSALRTAKRRIPSANLVLSDARWLPFRSDRYGLVICSEVLEHIREHAQVACELSRVLAPGGVALLTVPHGEQHWTWEDRVDGHLRRYTENEFADLMMKAGLTVDEMRCWGFPLAVLFRKAISTPLYNRGIHESKIEARRSPIFRILLRLIVALFRFDDLFHGTQLGLGLVAKLRKPSVPHGTTGNRDRLS